MVNAGTNMMLLRSCGRKGFYGITRSRLTINNNKVDKMRRSQKKPVEAGCHGYLGKCDVKPLKYVNLSYAAVRHAGVGMSELRLNATADGRRVFFRRENKSLSRLVICWVHISIQK